jgi:hypothetical protein
MEYQSTRKSNNLQISLYTQILRLSNCLSGRDPTRAMVPSCQSSPPMLKEVALDQFLKIHVKKASE